MASVFTRDKVILLSFLTGGHFMTHVLLVAYPVIAVLVGHDLNFVSRTEILSLITFTGVIYGTGAIFTGYLADRYDPLALVTLGLAFSTVSAFGIAFSLNYWMMVVFFALLGVGLSFYHPAGLSFISKIFGPKDRGKALGANGIGGDLGLVVSPVVTVAIAEAFGWRSAYIIWGVVGLALVGVALFLFGERVLRPGLFKAGGGNGEVAGGNGGRRKLEGMLDMTQMSTVEDVGPAERKAYWAGLSVMLTVGVGIVLLLTIFRGVLFHGVLDPLPTYLNKDKGITVFSAGVLTSVMYLMGAIGEPIGGWVKDKYNARTPLIIFSLVCGGAVVLLIISTNVIPIIIAMMAFGFSMFMMMSVVNTLVADVTPPEVRGTFYGISFFTRDGLGFLGPLMVGIVADATGGFAAAYWIMAVFALLTTAVSFAVERPRFGWGKSPGKAAAPPPAGRA